MNPIEIIRAACIEANPDIVSVPEWNGAEGRTIRLADVLLAIGEKAEGPVDYAIDAYGRFRMREKEGPFNWVKIPDGLSLVEWNLRKDDLTQQSPETLQFLAGLLK